MGNALACLSGLSGGVTVTAMSWSFCIRKALNICLSEKISLFSDTGADLDHDCAERRRKKGVENLI
jgi:hypothetical protein